MLADDDLPSFFQSADTCSLTGQARFLRQNRLQFWGLGIAALGGALTIRTGRWDVAGLAALLAFGMAMLMRLQMVSKKYDRMWYDGRAAAESAKTLAWRYSVGGRPFPLSEDAQVARALLITRLGEIQDAVQSLSIVPRTTNREISPQMELLRTSDGDTRRQAYRRGRLEDQRTWYASKAKTNTESAEKWQRVVLGAEVVGLLLALGKATGVIGIDFLGIASAIAAGAAGWLQVRQHLTLAHAYSVAAHELNRTLELSNEVMDEEAWSEFVDEAEEAVSREHTMWAASRGAPALR